MVPKGKSIELNRDRCRRANKLVQCHDFDMDALHQLYRNPIRQPAQYPFQLHDVYWWLLTQPTDESMNQHHCTAASVCGNSDSIFAKLQPSMGIHLNNKFTQLKLLSIHFFHLIFKNTNKKFKLKRTVFFWYYATMCLPAFVWPDDKNSKPCLFKPIRFGTPHFLSANSCSEIFLKFSFGMSSFASLLVAVPVSYFMCEEKNSNL